jgi:MFS family permease
VNPRKLKNHRLFRLNQEQEFQEEPLKGLTPNVLKLGFISLIADVASEMLYPIMPLFLSTVLGAPALAIGLIEGLAELTASILKLYSGSMSDRTKKRKPWILVGYLLSAFGKSSIGLASSWGWVLASRITDRFGKGVRTAPRDALLSDSISSRNQGKAFGWHRGMDTLGAALGPLIALGMLGFVDGDLRKLFFFSFIPAILSVVAVIWVKEVPAHSHEPSLSFRISELPRPFWKFLTVLVVFGLANSSDVFLILRFQKIENSLTSLILTYCGFNLVYALSSPWLGGLADRIGLRKCFFAGYFLFTGVYFLYAIADNLGVLVSGFLIYGLYMATTEGVSKALAVSLVPKHLKGTALGVMGLTIGIASLFASVTAGVLWDQVSPSAVFYFGAAGSVFSAFLFFLLKI